MLVRQNPTNPLQKRILLTIERLTTAEDDLLYCLLHDVRLGNSLAQVIEPSWLDTKVVAGRILAKILAEMLADGPLDISEMQDLLEEDEERFVFQNLLYQESSDDSDYDPINLANQCVSALFLRHTRKSEKILLHQLREPDSDNHSTNELRTQLKEQEYHEISAPNSIGGLRSNHSKMPSTKRKTSTNKVKLPKTESFQRRFLK